jgi:hypothetical protein
MSITDMCRGVYNYDLWKDRSYYFVLGYDKTFLGWSVPAKLI